MNLFTPDAIPGVPYWWQAVDWPDLSDIPPQRVDLLVIGAGYTGLSAAITAHDRGAKVAVIDAGQPGKGASTRNGGMFGAHPRLGWDALNRHFGPNTADALFAEAPVASDWALNLINREGIDCDYEQTGRIQLAYTPAHFKGQKGLANVVKNKSTARCNVVERNALGTEIATERYHGGLVFPDHGALHPAKYHRGLLDAALRRGIPVAARCPASAFQQHGTGHRITTSRGDVVADKVVLATNGYTRPPFRWFSSRVFPLPSYLIATEPLSPNLIGELAPGRRMMVETRARHSYFRISPDGKRILFGGRAAMVDIDLKKAAYRLHDTMTEIWPVLRQTRISHVWSGHTGYSFSHMPAVGEKDGIHYAMGFSGSGTVMAAYLGAKAALRALNDADGATAFADTGLAPRWFHRGGRPHFLKAADLWYRNWVDTRETWASRR